MSRRRGIGIRCRSFRPEVPAHVRQQAQTGTFLARKPRWRRVRRSGSLGRLCARRSPGLRSQHMHNPPVAESLQPFSPKEVG